MIAYTTNGITSNFGFTYKSHSLSNLYEEDICVLCLCFFEDISDQSSFVTKITAFIKDYNFTSDVENGVINYLIIILPETKTCRSFSKSQPFKDELEKHRFSFLRNDKKPVFVLYDDKGLWQTTESMISENDALSELINEIKLHGIYNIFEIGNGILESGPGHHYVLQNKFHADKFIRTANILTNSNYIDFLAIFLLEFMSDDDNLIYIDTSGIISIVYAINKLKRIFHSGFHPSIASFNSYDGIHHLINDGHTKIIISASTSGKLSKLLLDRHFSPKNVIILFYLNKNAPNVSVLCNLFDFNQINKSKKYSHFQIEHEAGCSFCANSSYPIKIVGEQFLPEELKVDTFSFDISDCPLWLSKFMRKYFNKPGIISCYFRKEMTGLRKDIFLDFEKILKIDSEIENNKFDKYCSTKLPNEIDTLIHYNDNGSVYLKNLILNKYKKNENIQVLEDSQINSYKEALRNKNILTISSTITNGKRLVETSLKLRESSCRGISYFVALSRSPDEMTLDTTRKYIGFDNKFGRDINPLIIVDSIFISDSSKSSTFSESNASSWEEEQDFFSNSFEDEIFNPRKSEIMDEKGLIENLFWGNSNNEKLKLRKNFAFYSGLQLSTESTSQAEVFFVINSILHNLRRNTEKNIFQSAFHRNVISPETFICYNDGIIQSSILRAANPIELNYSFLGNNLKVGIEMINMLQHVFNNFENETGEATIEFLIAICTRRLQLIQKELHKLITSLVVRVQDSSVKQKNVILKLCDYIKNNI